MNYGALLQAYALQHKIETLGGDAYIIDYKSVSIDENLKLIRDNEKLSPKILLKAVFRKIKHNKFFKFMKNHLNLTFSVKSQNDLKELNSEFDAFIVGSDQVFNDGCIKGDGAYVLDFVKESNKRFSYAASIGGDETKAQETLDKYKSNLEKFNTISIRERNIQNYLSNALSKDIRCDIDPVLLLDKHEWLKLTSKRRLKQKYVFVYLIGEPNNILDFAKEYAKRNNLVLIDCKTSSLFFKYCSPEDFLSWIYYADTVITNSFHGTAFSILFEKNFYVEYKTAKGYNFRSKQLVEDLKIENREITSSSLPNENTLPNYNLVKKDLDIYRANSEKYLQQIINR
jgi:hypothetical protein